MGFFIIIIMEFFGFQRHPIMSAKWLLSLLLALSGILKGKKKKLILAGTPGFTRILGQCTEIWW